MPRICSQASGRSSIMDSNSNTVEAFAESARAEAQSATVAEEAWKWSTLAGVEIVSADIPQCHCSAQSCDAKMKRKALSCNKTSDP